HLPGSLDPQGSGEVVLPGSWNRVPPGLRLEEYENLLWREELATLLIHGYAGIDASAGGAVPDTLTEPELVRFSFEARPLGIELRYFDPADLRAANRRFRDANLFLFPSNGDERLDLAEITELLRYLLSGKRTGDDIHRAIARNCENGPLDI